MKKTIMSKFIMFFAVAVTSLMLVGTSAYGDHKPNHNPGGGGGGGTVADIEIGNFYFSPDPFSVTVSLSGPDVWVSWYNNKGNHDVTFAKMVMMPDGTMEHVIIAQIDLSPREMGSINISAILADLGLDTPGTYSQVYHCHAHETQDMMGFLTITVTE